MPQSRAHRRIVAPRRTGRIAALWLALLGASLAHSTTMTALAAQSPVVDTSATTISSAARVDVPAWEHPLYLPESLRVRMRAAGLYAPGSETHRLRRVVAFVQEDAGLGVRYREGATGSAAEVAERREADCVGFTLLFLALARELGLRVQAQRIDHVLSWQVDARTVYRSGHVNARVRIGGRLATVDFAAEGLIAERSPHPIGDTQLLAEYRGNLAMSAFAAGDTAGAQSHLDAALRLDPDHPPLWSNQGVLRAHRADTTGAEQAYLHALALDPDQPAALANLIALRQSRGEDTQSLSTRLARVRARDPFYPVLLAARAIAAGDDSAAIEHYREAIRRMPREPRLHAALAALYVRQGEHRHALAALRNAARYSEGADRAWYHAQRKALDTAR